MINHKFNYYVYRGIGIRTWIPKINRIDTTTDTARGPRAKAAPATTETESTGSTMRRKVLVPPNPTPSWPRVSRSSSTRVLSLRRTYTAWKYLLRSIRSLIGTS